MQKKDKEKVFGGDWTEEQFREFMLVESYDGTDKDFISGIRAYRHMLPETFAQFVAQFKAEGHNLSAADLEAALREGAGDLLESITLFDRYDKIGDGKVSLAFTLVFRASDRTLTGDEVSAMREAATAVAAAKCGAIVRTA